jgi:uncharacterized membrane protein YtjA (UPF0391 family)
MSLRAVTVRRDWRQIEQEGRAAARLARLLLQWALVLFALVSLVPAVLGSSSAAMVWINRVLFLATFIVLPIWICTARRPGRTGVALLGEPPVVQPWLLSTGPRLRPATCGAASRLCGLMPITFSWPRWQNIPCGATFYVINDDRIEEGN